MIIRPRNTTDCVLDQEDEKLPKVQQKAVEAHKNEKFPVDISKTLRHLNKTA
jgi:hypothetical protein